MNALESLQVRLGIKFNNPALLARALTHRSYLNENPDYPEDNERMEFLGDAVLDYVTADFLYHRYPEMSEGELTRMRAALVRTEQLAELARGFDIGEQMHLGRGAAESGGRERDSLLCDTFEAIIGALTLDAGVEAARSFIERLFATLADSIIAAQTHVDSKSLLQEWSQATHGVTPQYRTIEERGPDHDKEFTIDVLIGERTLGSGRGRSKQSAAQAAAEAALINAGIV